MINKTILGSVTTCFQCPVLNGTGVALADTNKALYLVCDKTHPLAICADREFETMVIMVKGLVQPQYFVLNRLFACANQTCTPNPQCGDLKNKEICMWGRPSSG